ncbi:MAG TPA: N-6 DNA methylase [Verrucomicrobiae bacterium]|nr:N-6 DNA methylase [Verrucomicrobiae bacterium]
MNSNAKIEFGDFQTPQILADEICALLTKRQIVPEIILEPTCGVGSFLVAAAKTFSNAKLFGWDINSEYIEQAGVALNQIGAAKRSSVSAKDFFKHDWETELAGIQNELLILGNLPWVTNATVSGLNGANLPAKQNFQNFRGIEARTGKSNFDISEWMLIQLIKSLRGKSATIAMLCKTAIARKLLRFAWQNDGRISKASLHRIDAKKYFNASVDACLLLVQTGSSGPMEAAIFDNLQAQTPSKVLGLIGQDLVSDVRIYRKLKHFEGLCPYQWRSGVKHDCSSVMELWRKEKNIFRNKLDEETELESEFLFPLLKCSDLANGRIEPNRFVLITQTRVGQDTSEILTRAPRTWNYLDSHRKLFDARKSSIYSNRIPFALFGIGDYSFAPWKVAVSGLHKIPRFLFIEPFENKPVLFDDTCYFLPFQNEDEAKIVAEILNSRPCLQFISSLLFEDSKRPITVELLERLNLHAIAEAAGLADEWKSVRSQNSFYLENKIDTQAEFIMERAVKH